MRTDIHKPSVINPADYEFVCMEFIKMNSLGDCYAMQAERAIQEAHMQRTGGVYSHHEHGGNCMVCGAAAVYTVLFYHQKTNSYIRTGQDCARKMEMSYDENRYNAFRKGIANAIEAQAGKKKAQAMLAEQNLSVCWTIYTANMNDLPVDPNSRGEIRDSTTGELIAAAPIYREELKVRDIVGSVVKFGKLTEAQVNYLKSLMKRITDRPAILAARAAEKAAAADCPTGRVTVSGEVIKIEERENNFVHSRYDPATTWKMTVKAASGYIVWVTVPGRMDIPKRGDKVVFVATLTPSDRDPKFGFGKRPVFKEHAPTTARRAEEEKNYEAYNERRG